MGGACRERCPDIGQLVFRRGEDHRDRLDLRDRDDAGLGRGVDDVADIDLTQPDDARDRRLDGGIVELGLGVEDRRVVGGDLRRQLRDGGALGIGLLPGREFAEFGEALQIEIGVGKVAPRPAPSWPWPDRAPPGTAAGSISTSVSPCLTNWPSLKSILQDLPVDAGADHDRIKSLHRCRGRSDRPGNRLFRPGRS